MDDYFIRYLDLHKAFDHKRVLRGVNLEVRRGEAVLARAQTDASGRLAVPLQGPGPLRIRLRSPGAPPASLPLAL